MQTSILTSATKACALAEKKSRGNRLAQGIRAVWTHEESIRVAAEHTWVMSNRHERRGACRAEVSPGAVCEPMNDERRIIREIEKQAWHKRDTRRCWWASGDIRWLSITIWRLSGEGFTVL